MSYSYSSIWPTGSVDGAGAMGGAVYQSKPKHRVERGGWGSRTGSGS